MKADKSIIKVRWYVEGIMSNIFVNSGIIMGVGLETIYRPIRHHE
jgi:hypothetical protein